MQLLSTAPWLDSQLAFVANSGSWIGRGIDLAAGNRYKGEWRKHRHSPQHEKIPNCRGSWGFNLRSDIEIDLDVLELIHSVADGER